MKKKKDLRKNIFRRSTGILFVLFPLLIVSILSLVKCNKEPEENPGLTAADLLYELPEKAEKKYAEAVIGTDLEKIFNRETINCFYTGQSWVGRIKDRGVSHQALITIDNTRITYKIGRLKRQRLNFSIYNPAGSKLFYRIYLENKFGKRKLYSGFYDGLKFFSGVVHFHRSFEKDDRLVFETRGRGPGAWVNPRFSRVKKNPRIFLCIVLDTLRCDHTSLYGYHRKTTPVIDKLASDSRVFRRAYSSTSWTLPAHVSLFSGKNLVEHRVTTPENHIPEDFPLVAEVFQKHGFVTAAFTGGGFVDSLYGFHRGFQVYSVLPGRVFHLNSAEMVLNHFKNYIETYWGDDLFVFLHTYQVHAPYKFPPKYVRHFNKDLKVNLKGPGNFIRDKRTGYYSPIDEKNRQVLLDLYDTAIYYADEALVGGVIGYLKKKGVYDQSMILVMSDHGEEFYDHGSWEHGHSLYNELVRIPLIVKYPGNRKRGDDHSLVSITDIPGMMLKESGLPYDESVFSVHSGNRERVLPVLFPHSPIIKQVPPKVSFISQDYHFIYNIIDPEDIKIFDPPPANLEIFELYAAADTQEKTNLAKKRPKEMREFRALLKTYLQMMKGLEGTKSKLDKNLEQELKSLGYLKD